MGVCKPLRVPRRSPEGPIKWGCRGAGTFGFTLNLHPLLQHFAMGVPPRRQIVGFRPWMESTSLGMLTRGAVHEFFLDLHAHADLSRAWH